MTCIRKSLLWLLPALILASCASPPWMIPGGPEQSSSDPPALESGTGTVPMLDVGDVPAAGTDGVAVPGSDVIQERLDGEGRLQLGSPDALELMLFTNHSCDYCSQFAKEYLPRLQRDFLGNGRLRLSINLIAIKKYPNSSNEAAAVLCAAKQDKGVAMHLALFDLSTRTRKGIDQLAKAQKLNVKEFTACMDNPATRDAVTAREEWAKGMGVTLVPSFDLDSEAKTGLPTEAAEGAKVGLPTEAAEGAKVGLPAYADLRGWLESR